MAMGAATYVEEALRWLPEEDTGNWRSDSVHPRISPSARLPLSPSAHILLADDNADMRDYVKRLLVTDGYEVETVVDGVAALASVRQQRPDLVLTDVMMPGVDGLGVLRALRNDPNTREIPIILLSARAGEESRIEGLEAGADDYLIKPFSARELLARVEATLKLAQLRQEAMRQEQKLRIEAQSAEANLERVLTSINDQFLVLDSSWCYTYVNDRVVEAVGISKEDLLGKCTWDLFPDLVKSKFYTEVHRAVAEQTVVQFEYYYPSWQRWFENRVYPSARGVSILVTEITERKRAEADREQLLQELALERARFESVLRQMPAGVMIADADSGKLVLTNEQAKQIVGYDYKQSRHLTEYDEIAPFEGFRSDGQPYGAKDYPLMRSLQRGETICNEEIELHRSDGRRIFVNVNSAPVLDGEGQIVAAVVVFQDVTDRKQAEQEREQLLAREQAIRKEAQRANRIKDEFLAVLSHELRSPLNPILGWSRLLQTRQFDAARTTEALIRIERNAKLQAELIEDLLDVSRILQGKLSLNVARVELKSTLEAAMETVRLAAEAKSIQMHVQIEPQVGQVWGDTSRLQQVLWNLLSNAIKFTPQGGRVEIRLERKGSQAQIIVSDTGKGIPADFLPYVFEHFRQADATTTRKFGGLGLGLAIVRHLVELHGGTVQAESPGEGQGATFTVRLPCLLPQSQTDPDSEQPEPYLDLHDVEILVVDDDTDTREFVAFLLEQYGARVRAVGSASEALTALTQALPDVLLSDIGMPDVDGYMLMQQVRTLPPEQGGQIPAIALTAYAGEINHQQAIAAGFQSHLSKPVEPAELVDEITCLAKLSRKSQH
jgi:PAS domain S-box-containing protein